MKHLDRCLSCLSCMSACPSGVDYMHLADIARSHVERRHHRPAGQNLIRRLLLGLMTRPRLFSALMPLLRVAATAARPLLSGSLRAMCSLACVSRNAGEALLPVYPAAGRARGAVALLPGCVQQGLGNEINHATVRLLNRLGYTVHVLADVACCGALEQHMGRTGSARGRARANIVRWRETAARTGAETLIVNASGCGTVLKDYAHLLREDGAIAGDAGKMAAAVMDLAEFLDSVDFRDLPPRPGPRPAVAWQNPCSMLHGQKLGGEVPRLLQLAGYEVSNPEDAHLCCGSAGTYNLLQPALAESLGRSKAGALLAVQPDIVAGANLGCILQLRQYLDCPVLHWAELADWAYGGPPPQGCDAGGRVAPILPSAPPGPEQPRKPA